MALHNVVIKSATASYMVDSFGRTAVFDTDVDNGCVAVLNTYSEREDESMVWKAEQATATSKGLWMATSPEVVITRAFDGDEANGVPALDFRGIINDVRAFYNPKGMMVDMILLQKGDIIEMTGAGITGIEEDSNTYLVPDTTGYKLKASTSAGTGLALRKTAKSKLHIGNGSLVKVPVTTYKFTVEEN